MSFIGKIFDWMGEHKLLTAGGAAAIGYLVVPKLAHAANILPGTAGARAVPGGGIVSSVKVIPPPALNNTVKTVFRVTTRDPMPEGMLNARATDGMGPDGPTGAKIGYWPKDGLVEMLDPGSGTGLIYVRGPGVGSQGETLLEGWAYKGYLSPAN